MELVQAAAAVPTTNNIDGDDGLVPRVGTGLGDRPLYEVHINSIIIDRFVSTENKENEESSIPNINFSLSILSIGLLAVLRRN